MKDASNFHKQVRDILLCQDGPFSGYTILQEIPVKNLCPKYPFKSHRFDFLIKELELIIEVHGEQHYFINFDFNRDEHSIDKFYKQKYRDVRKAEAAILHGYTYIEIPFLKKKDLNALWIMNEYSFNFNSLIKKNKSSLSLNKRVKLIAEKYRRNK